MSKKPLTNEQAEAPTASHCSSSLALDVSAEQARALYRVVRAMHDGHCPKCGFLGSADMFVSKQWDLNGGKFVTGHHCPSCKFKTTRQQEMDALRLFQPYLTKSVEIFEKWRS